MQKDTKINKRKFRKEIFATLKMFARLYSAGVPPIDSLEIFCDESNLDWKIQTLEKLKSGKTFGQSIEELALPLKEYELTIIKKSEQSGNLAGGINRLCDMNKSIEKTKSKLTLALIYPLIIGFVSLLLILLILVIIVPKIRPLFSGDRIQIPWSTQVLFFFSSNLVNIILILSILLFTSGFLILLLIKKKGRDILINYVNSMIIKFPILGPLINNYSASISFRIAGEVFASSGLLVDSLRDSARGSVIQKERRKLLNVAKEVESGIPLSKSIGKNLSKENKIWLPLIVCGEQTGSISETFYSIANIHQEHFDDTVSVINKIIEPISMIIVGLGVGFIAISIITPMYSLISYTGY